MLNIITQAGFEADAAQRQSWRHPKSKNVVAKVLGFQGLGGGQWTFVGRGGIG